MNNIKKYLVTGLIILLPVAVTLAVLTFIINFLTEPFMGAISYLFKILPGHMQDYPLFRSEHFILYISKFLILILLFLTTVGIGIITRIFFIQSLLRLSDKILHRIPIVNSVYKTTQDIIKTLFNTDKNSFQQVVMVQFPQPGIYALGLISRESPSICSEAVNQELISVLIPTTPNPTTGFLLMYKKEDLIYVDVKPEDAIKYIVSCGVIIPENKKTV